MDKRVINGRIRRRKHDEAFKRELVSRSLQPGASVAAIAQDNGINANLLFNWRRLYLRSGAAASSPPGPVLLPVTLREERATPATTATATTATRPGGALARVPNGVIEIDIGSARVRVRGVVDETTVRCVLHALGSVA